MFIWDSIPGSQLLTTTTNTNIKGEGENNKIKKEGNARQGENDEGWGNNMSRLSLFEES